MWSCTSTVLRPTYVYGPISSSDNQAYTMSSFEFSFDKMTDDSDNAEPPSTYRLIFSMSSCLSANFTGSPHLLPKGNTHFPCNIIVMGTTSTRSIRAKETIWLVPAFPHLQADVSGSGLLWGILSLQCHRGCYGAVVGSYPSCHKRPREDDGCVSLRM
jgi:hypothetical protein